MAEKSYKTDINDPKIRMKSKIIVYLT